MDILAYHQLLYVRGRGGKNVLLSQCSYLCPYHDQLSDSKVKLWYKNYHSYNRNIYTRWYKDAISREYQETPSHIVCCINPTEHGNANNSPGNKQGIHNNNCVIVQQANVYHLISHLNAHNNHISSLIMLSFIYILYVQCMFILY